MNREESVADQTGRRECHLKMLELKAKNDRYCLPKILRNIFHVEKGFVNKSSPLQ